MRHSKFAVPQQLFQSNCVTVCYCKGVIVGCFKRDIPPPQTHIRTRKLQKDREDTLKALGFCFDGNHSRHLRVAFGIDLYKHVHISPS